MSDKSKRNKADPLPLPFDFKPFVVEDKLWLEWWREPGMVDGFILYGGKSATELVEIKRVPVGFKRSYIEKITPGENFFFSIAAQRGENIGEKLAPIEVDLQSQRHIIPCRDRKQIVNVVRTSQSATPALISGLCVYCGAKLELNTSEKIFVCSSCGAQHVQRVADEKFISVDILTNGICACCNPRRPLIKAARSEHLVCSQSGEEYVNNGVSTIRIVELDYGLCTCCNPSNALILNQQGQVVCSAQRDHLYEKRNGVYVFHPPETINTTIDDIDRALSDGSAILLPGGVLSAE